MSISDRRITQLQETGATRLYDDSVADVLSELETLGIDPREAVLSGDLRVRLAPADRKSPDAP